MQPPSGSINGPIPPNPLITGTTPITGGSTSNAKISAASAAASASQPLVTRPASASTGDVVPPFNEQQTKEGILKLEADYQNLWGASDKSFHRTLGALLLSGVSGIVLGSLMLASISFSPWLLAIPIGLFSGSLISAIITVSKYREAGKHLEEYQNAINTIKQVISTEIEREVNRYRKYPELDESARKEYAVKLKAALENNTSLPNPINTGELGNQDRQRQEVYQKLFAGLRDFIGDVYVSGNEPSNLFQETMQKKADERLIKLQGAPQLTSETREAYNKSFEGRFQELNREAAAFFDPNVEHDSPLNAIAETLTKLRSLQSEITKHMKENAPYITFKPADHEKFGKEIDRLNSLKERINDHIDLLVKKQKKLPKELKIEGSMPAVANAAAVAATSNLPGVTNILE